MSEPFGNSEQLAPVTVAICGPARSGKGTVKEWLTTHTGLYSPLSTSEFYWLLVMGRKESELAKIKATAGGRKRLAAEIDGYNQIDNSGCRLYACMTRNDYRIIEGIRRLAELRACCERRIVTHLLWVDAEERLKAAGIKPDRTLDYTRDDAAGLCDDFSVIVNDGPAEDLDPQLRWWCKTRGVPVIL